MKPVIAVTIGDPAGIGPEITTQAISSRRIQSICSPLVIGNSYLLKPFLRKNNWCRFIDIPYTLHKKIQQGKAAKQPGMFALQAIKKAVAVCLNGQADALVTAPVSKHACRMSDPLFTGHTEMLGRLCHVKDPVMMMQARHMRFIMITRHVPLARVSRFIARKAQVKNTIWRSIKELNTIYHQHINKIVICALNPHAGEEGAIGSEERKILIPVIAKLRKQGYRIEGPLPADIAVQRLAQKKYDLCFGMYHDQVMIPLKITYPREIVNITLGLPFIRTSPGHGVAYDIAGKNKADARPMEEAIITAVVFAKKRFNK